MPERLAPEAVRLDPRTLDAGDLTRWGELADRAIEPNPFLRPEFVLATVIERGIPGGAAGRPVRLALDRLLLVRRRGPTLRLPLPNVEALTDAVLPSAARRSSTVTCDRGRRWVHRRRHARSAALLPCRSGCSLQMARSRRPWLPRPPRRGIRPIVYSDFERAAWHRSADSTFPAPSSTARTVASSRGARRLLASELGGEIQVVDHTLEPGAWEAFLAMEDSGWKAERGTALGSSAADAAFFRRMCAGMSAAGRLEVVGLEVGGRTVAMECHLVDGDVLYSFKIAHDPAFRKFSPGTQLKYRVIERLAERGLRLADSCAVPGQRPHEPAVARSAPDADRALPDRRPERSTPAPGDVGQGYGAPRPRRRQAPPSAPGCRQGGFGRVTPRLA